MCSSASIRSFLIGTDILLWSPVLGLRTRSEMPSSPSWFLLEPDDLGKLFENAGPLATFYAKINFGFAFGLFGPKTRADLNWIRDIRNAFAHATTSISFQSPEVLEACGQIHTKPRDPGPLDPGTLDLPEMQYLGAAQQLSMDLLKIATRDEPGPVLP